MELHMAEHRARNKYANKYDHEAKYGPTTERFECRKVGPAIDHILADQAYPYKLELGRYGKYLTAEILWELGLRVRDTVRAIDLSDWEGLTMVQLRSLTLNVGPVMTSLSLSRTPVTNEMLHLIGIRFDALHTLDLSQCAELVDNSMEGVIGGCRGTLTSLNVSGCPGLTHEALKWLAGVVGHPPKPCLKLQSLNISGCKLMRNEGLQALGSVCRHLQYLNMAHCAQLTDDAVVGVATGCRKLRVLNAERCDFLTDVSLISLGANCPLLRSLNVCRDDQITDEGLRGLAAGCTSLQSLNVAGLYSLTEAGIFYIADACKSIQFLNMDGCERVTEKGLRALLEGLEFVENAESYFGFKPKDHIVERKLSAQHRAILSAHALTIQCLVRCHIARLAVKRKRLFIAKKKGVLDIQRVWRGYRGREDYWERNERYKEWRATFVVYRCVMRLTSRMRARKAAERARVENNKVMMINKVKAMFKSRRLRRLHPEGVEAVAMLRQQRIVMAEAVAGVRLQAMGRGMVSRLKFKAIREFNVQRQRDIYWAANSLQRVWRGKKAREFVAEYRAYREKLFLEHTAAAQDIQRLYRGFLGRNHFKWYKANVERIKAERNKAATDMQRAARGFLGRQLYRERRRRWAMEMRAATKLQAQWNRHATPTWQEFKMMHAKEVNDVRYAKHKKDAYDSSHAKWRVLQDELARESASDDSDDDDWAEMVDEHTGLPYWWSPSRGERLDEWHDEFFFEHSLIGKRVKIYWPQEETWYEGEVSKFNKKRKLFKVTYTDGDTDWVNPATDPERISIFEGEEKGWIMWRHLPKPNPLKEYRSRRDTALKSAGSASALARGLGATVAAWGEAQDRQLASAQSGSSGLSGTSDAAASGTGAGVWTMYYDDATGAPYWVNNLTGESSWQNPALRGGGGAAGAGAGPAGAGGGGAADDVGQAIEERRGNWERVRDDDGNVFFYNVVTEESEWDPPPEWT